MKTAQYLLLLLLFAAPWRSLAQTHQCNFDSLWQVDAQNDSFYSWKHNAHIARVNDFRAKTPWNYQIIDTGTGTSGLQGGCENALFVIPVVVHVVYDPNNPASNLADSLIEKQLDILNAGFAATGIQFCLAKKDPYGSPFSGINHISDNNPIYERANDSQRYHLASKAYYDRERYLNIWVVNNITDNGQYSYTKGYSNIKYRGGVDGIIMRYEWFGDYSVCSTCGFHQDARAKALIHEVGHYLGLFHTFQGGCSAGPDSLTCNIQGDYCCDTRPTLLNMNCPVPSGNQCSSLPFYGSQTDNYENYMAYAEPCLDNFTTDQISVMHSQLSNDRRNLVAASNVNNLGLNCCLSVAWFNVENMFLCQPGILTFHAIDYDSSVSYNWRLYNDTTVLLDTTVSDSSFSWTLSQYGIFHVRLSFFINGKNILLERKDLVELRDCGNPMASAQGNWFFGARAGLRFYTGGVVADASADIPRPKTIYSGDGGISHSDVNGNLLFYAGGDSSGLNILRLYRPNAQGQHIQVNKDSTLYGHNSCSQTGIVIPFKHDSTRFHLFVANSDDVDPACYHNVLDIDVPDLVMNGYRNLAIPVPVGSVTNPNGTVETMEQITAIPACDGNHWLIVVDGSSSLIPNYKKLLVYLVTDSTVTYVSKSDDQVQDYFGQMKASPDGTMIVAPGVVFRFDRESGALTTLRKLPLSGIIYNGASFSPDSRLLYLYQNTDLYQFDLESTDSLLSGRKVPFAYTFAPYTMQLGPDEKIYLSKPGHDNLAVISNPNNRINLQFPNACGFNEDGPSLKDADGNGGICILGLPNMMDARYPGEIALDFSMVDSNCGTVMFFPNDACASSYLWRFDDGDSSILREPVHQYADTGTYQVMLTINGITQVTRNLRIGIDRPIITGDTVVSCNLSDVTYYTLANLDPEFTYQWSANGGSVLSVEDFENAVVQWDTIGSLFVTARNTLNQCSSADTVIIRPGNIRDNTISPDSGVCFSGMSYTFTGSLPEINFMDTVIHFQWQSANSDSGAWVNISSTDTLKDYSLSLPDPAVWYRRIASTANCESISNVIKLGPKLSITENLRSFAACSNGPEFVTFPLGLYLLDSTDTVQLEFHRYKETSPTVFNWVVEDSAIYPDDFARWAEIGDSFKIKITLEGCGSMFTDTVVLAQPITLKYGLHTELKCENVVVMGDLRNMPFGKDTFFYAIPDTAIAWIGQAQNADSFFRWEKYNHTTGQFELIPNSSNDTLFVKADYCDQGIYRARIRLSHDFNPANCGWVSSCNWDTLGIGVDLWARDGVADNGTEANPDSTRDFWNSPDLWNCWSATNCSIHESPEYMTQGWNYVRNTLRNKGSYASDSFNVYLYWTLGGFYEKWPLSWHYDLTNNGFINSNLNDTFPMGAEIGIAGVSNINAGTSKTITYEWAPPHPSWYDTSTYYNADRVVHPLCILSRIVACDEDPYGMTFPEIEPTGKNVINNNNIVTRNTEVYDSIGTNKKTPVYVLRAGNQVNTPRKIRIAADNAVTNFWDIGYYTLRLSENLMDAWQNSGADGNGYSLSGDVFTIDEDGFYLDNIDLVGDEWGWAYFQFHLNPLDSINEDRGEQLFRFVQFSGDSAAPTYIPDGGFNFLLRLKAPVDNSEGMIISDPDKKEKEATEQGTAEVLWHQELEKKGDENTQTTPVEPVNTSVIAYPNPSSDLVYFGLTLEAERTIGIELYNSLGAEVGEIKTKTYSAGKHNVSFDAGRLAPGTYLAKINVNGEVKLISLVIVR